jgi:hypothetical protein
MNDTPILFWPFMVLVLAYLVVTGFFLNYLKRAHHEVWLELGSPTLFLNNSIKNGFLTLRFLYSARHKNLNDPHLTRFIWLIRGLSALAYFLFFVLVIGLVS